MTQRIRKYSNLPIAVGFGISNPEQAREVAGYAEAVVVGSALTFMVQSSSAIVRIVRAACAVGEVTVVAGDVDAHAHPFVEDQQIPGQVSEEKARQYYEANKEKWRLFNSRRRARMSSAPGHHTAEQWQARLDYFGNKCRYCGVWR